MKTIKLAAMASALLGLGALSGTAAAFDVNNCGTTGIGSTGTVCPWVQYGDGISYNLAVNSSLYNNTNGGGTGPGNPFYVDSTPGAIKDLTVLGTGSGGNPVNTNFPGMDNAYPTPNDVQGNVFFSTNKTPYLAAPGGPYVVGQTSPISLPADPGGVGQFAGDTANTWDATVAALKGFLGTGNVPIFFFNNNQTNSGSTADQSLAIWARITLYNPTTGLADGIFDFTNRSLDSGNLPGTFFQTPLGGGKLLGDPTTFTTTSPAGPVAGDQNGTDYVLAGGQTCFNPTTGQLALPDLATKSCPAGFTQTINSNLGANQAAYAVLFPELNAMLASGLFDNDTMQVDFRMGCDPFTTNWLTDEGSSTGNCLARSLNNGYEQIFITAFNQTTGKTVPEPATLALMGLGLAGLGWARRRGVAAA